MEDEVGKTELGAIMFSRFYHLAMGFYSLVSPPPIYPRALMVPFGMSKHGPTLS